MPCQTDGDQEEDSPYPSTFLSKADTHIRAQSRCSIAAAAALASLTRGKRKVWQQCWTGVLEETARYFEQFLEQLLEHTFEPLEWVIMAISLTPTCTPPETMQCFEVLVILFSGCQRVRLVKAMNVQKEVLARSLISISNTRMLLQVVEAGLSLSEQLKEHEQCCFGAASVQ